MAFWADVACVVLAAPVVVAAAYLFALAFIGIGITSRDSNARTLFARRQRMGEPAERFALVIPAHDEEVGLPATLEACALLDYPRELFSVYVIADNCGDATARVARAAGVEVLERFNGAQRGKGHALAWALPQVLCEAIDAVVVIDADCRPDRDLLRVIAARMNAGVRAVQTSVVVADPDSGPAACLAALGNRIENDLFYAAKDRLGLAVFLRGTGMALSRSLLLEEPWLATSATEDHEYSLRLLRRGERIAFAAETAVRTPGAGDRELGVQRRRWASNLAGLPAVAGSLFWEGLTRRRLRLLDAAVSQLVMSRPLVLMHALSATTLMVALCSVVPTPPCRAALVACLASLIAHATCLAAAFVKLGPSPHRVSLLLSALPAAGRLVGAAAGGLFGRGRAWVRTPRPEVSR